MEVGHPTNQKKIVFFSKDTRYEKIVCKYNWSFSVSVFYFSSLNDVHVRNGKLLSNYTRTVNIRVFMKKISIYFGNIF